MAMPQVDWESIKSFVQIPLSWFKEVSRRSNLFSKHPLIIVERNNPDGIALNIDPAQLPKGGGGGGGGGGGSGGGFAYDEETMVIGPGAVAIGRQYIPVNQNGYATDGEGDWRVEVHLDEGFAAVMRGDGFEAPTKTLSFIPLYQLSGGKVVVDYRGAATVQAWEDYED